MTARSNSDQQKLAVQVWDKRENHLMTCRPQSIAASLHIDVNFQQILSSVLGWHS